MPRVYTKRRVENTTETVDPSPLTNLGAPYRVTIATSGGSGDGNVEYVAGGTDPNGSKTSTRPAICYDDIGNLWVKTNAGTNNTGWEKIVSAESVSEPVQAQEVEVPLLVKLLPKILPTIRKVEPVGVPLIRTESPQMPPIGLGETRSSRWKKFASSLKSLMASFFALWMVLLLIPMAAEGSLPPAIQHNPFTTNVPPANLTGDVTTSAGLATTLAAGSASVLNSGTLGAARLPAFSGGDVTSSAGSAVLSIGNNKVTGAMIALGSDAQGDIMYYDGTDWVRLGAGTDGFFLKTRGVGSNPPLWASVPGGGDALTSNPLSQFAATTSAQLLGVLSDETGTGKAVFNASPTIETKLTVNGNGLFTNSITTGTNAVGFASNVLTAAITTNQNLLAVRQDNTVAVNGSLVASNISTIGGAGTIMIYDADNSNLGAWGAPTDITTSYTNVMPAAPATGLYYGANSAGVITWSQIANGSSSTVLVGGTPPSFTSVPAGAMPALTGAITTSAGAVATSLGSFTSANLSGALTDETGSGVAVFATSPTLTTPTLGVATATSVDIGNADTTVARASAGQLSVEGVNVPTVSSTDTLSNKRVTARVTTITSSATPTVNSDNCDCVTITALAAAITSMTSSLSGTPNNFDQLEYRIKDDGTARAITWGASFVAGPTALPTTTVQSKCLHVYFEWDSVQSKWLCISSGSDA